MCGKDAHQEEPPPPPVLQEPRSVLSVSTGLLSYFGVSGFPLLEPVPTGDHSSFDPYGLILLLKFPVTEETLVRPSSCSSSSVRNPLSSVVSIVPVVQHEWICLENCGR